MNKKALSLAVCIAMALPTASNALSLGDIESNSSLNQPFEGTINLLSTSIKEANLLKVKVASPAVFNRVGIDRPAFLNSIRFRTTVRNGKPVIVVRSSQPINEPFLNFLLEVSWPNGQLLKEYTVLLDPPVLVQADTAIASNAAGVRKEPGRQNQAYNPPATTQVARQQPRRVVRSVAPARQTRLRRPAQPRAASSSRVRNYRVRRGDTLYKVASKLGYKGIRKEQMMVALFNKNKRAFSKRNMNNLKAGALLSRPSYQEAKALSSKRAKAEVVAQARAWKQGRAGSIAKKSTKPKTVVASNTPDKTNNQARVEVMGGNNSLNANLTAGGAGSATLKELTKQLALTNEALTTRLKENNDLKSRVSELESLLRQKNKLITLKSEQLARLQEKMRGAGISAPVQTNTEAPTIDSIADNEGTDIQQQVAIEQSNERGEIIRNNSDQLAMVTDTAPITNTEDTEDTASSPFKDDSTSSESDSLDIMGLLSSPAAMGVGGGTLLALLGGLWFMRRRKDSEEDYQDFDPIEIDNKMDDMTFDDSALANSSDPDMQSFDSPFEETELESPDIVKNEVNSNDEITKGNEQEDILQEADVYIVYGLHDQAESELKRAIDGDPNNLAYRVKLLENYKAAGNKEAFEEEANAFMKLDIDGKDAYLDEITAWGKTLLPESKLFDSNTLKTAGAGAAGVAIVAGTALANEKQSTDADSSEQLDLENTLSDEKLSELDEELENLNLDDILSEETSDGSELLGLNDDLGINFDDIDDLENIEIGETDSDDLFALGKEELEKEISDEDFEIEMDSTEKLLESVKNDEMDFLDLDNVESITDTDTNTKVDTTDTTNLDAANLNLDLDSNDFEKIMPKDNAYKKQVSSDLEEDNLLANFDDNLSFLDLDDDSEVIEETQIETKLDLARAYIDMGDIEGARSTLEEVLQEGSDEQKREAEDLLHQTG